MPRPGGLALTRSRAGRGPRGVALVAGQQPRLGEPRQVLEPVELPDPLGVAVPGAVVDRVRRQVGPVHARERVVRPVDRARVVGLGVREEREPVLEDAVGGGEQLLDRPGVRGGDGGRGVPVEQDRAPGAGPEVAEQGRPVGVGASQQRGVVGLAVAGDPPGGRRADRQRAVRDLARAHRLQPPGVPGELGRGKSTQTGHTEHGRRGAAQARRRATDSTISVNAAAVFSTVNSARARSCARCPSSARSAGSSASRARRSARPSASPEGTRKPVDALGDLVAQRADVGRHHRQPGGHRLDHRDRDALVHRGQREHVAAREQPRDVAAQPEERHRLLQAPLRRAPGSSRRLPSPTTTSRRFGRSARAKASNITSCAFCRLRRATMTTTTSSSAAQLGADLGAAPRRHGLGRRDAVGHHVLARPRARKRPTPSSSCR